ILYAAILLGDGEVDPAVGEQRGDGVTDRRGRIAAPQQVVGQAGGGAGGLASAEQRGQPAPRRLERALRLADVLESRRDPGLHHLAWNGLGGQFLAEVAAACLRAA